MCIRDRALLSIELLFLEAWLVLLPCLAGPKWTYRHFAILSTEQLWARFGVTWTLIACAWLCTRLIERYFLVGEGEAWAWQVFATHIPMYISFVAVSTVAHSAFRDLTMPDETGEPQGIWEVMWPAARGFCLPFWRWGRRRRIKWSVQWVQDRLESLSMF